MASAGSTRPGRVSTGQRAENEQHHDRADRVDANLHPNATAPNAMAANINNTVTAERVDLRCLCLRYDRVAAPRRVAKPESNS